MSSFGFVLCALAAILLLFLVFRPTSPSTAPASGPKSDAKPAADDEAPSSTPAAAAALPVLDLPVLSFADDDDIEATQVGLAAEIDADLLASAPSPALKILYDDEAELEEPTEARKLILVAATGHSDQGKRRERNEDSLLVREKDGLFVVADGMGGYRGGEIASALAVKTIDEAYATKTFEGLEHTTIPKRASELARAIQMANRAILATAKADRALEGMGTTVVAARFSTNKQRLYIGHVGDSRIYRFRNGALRQMTSDHTMKDFGLAGAQSAHLSRAVGIWPTVPVDVILGKPRAGDIYLLCSDGLTKMVTDEGIEGALRATAPELAVSELIKAANDNGGKDNVTVVIVSVHAPAPANAS